MDIIFIMIATLLTVIAQARVMGAYRKYAKVANSQGLTGKSVAESIINNNGYFDVTVHVSNSGVLSDHFDPKNKTVNLSPDVYNGRSIASVAIAAHECGHVMQYQTGSSMIATRNKLLPAAMVASNISWVVICIGIFINQTRGSLAVFYIGVALLGIVALFQLLTLPIELDASKRALATIKASNYVSSSEMGGVKSMLDAAAFTYLAALMTSVLTILRLLLSVRRSN